MDATYRWRLYLFLFGGLHPGGACIRGGLAFRRNVQFFPLIQEMGGLIRGGLKSGGGPIREWCVAHAYKGPLLGLRIRIIFT